MSATYETGHARNVANFEQLISHCLSYGTAYNPAKAAIKAAALNTLLTNSRAAINLVKEKHNLYIDAVNAREIIFKPLDQFTTRLLRALQSSDVTDEKIKDAKSIIRKIKGQRASAIEQKPAAETSEISGSDQAITPEPVPQTKSSSQRSYDNRLENFAKLVNLISTETGYAPNENELKLTTLNATIADMRAKNTAVINAITALNNARINRNKILYNKSTGLYDIAQDVKAYIGALYGTSSPEYKTVSRIKFTAHR